MADAAPPFDPPRETLAEAVAEQLDFAARLDTLERKVDAGLVRIGELGLRVSAFAADVERCANVATANQATLERLERLLQRMALKAGVSP